MFVEQQEDAGEATTRRDEMGKLEAPPQQDAPQQRSRAIPILCCLLFRFLSLIPHITTEDLCSSLFYRPSSFDTKDESADENPEIFGSEK